MKQAYESKNFSAKTLKLIDTINVVIREYQAQGFVLTVRQLYYQLVARGYIPNTIQEYKRAASIINDGKLAGLIDWDAIEDRTREFIRQSHWTSGEQILAAAANGYNMDHWVGQVHRVFIIVEKEALVGVLERTCVDLDIPLLAARGYPSGSVLREFAQKDVQVAMRHHKQIPVILHLGDHDPSGIDMSRDLTDRVSLFANDAIDLRRIALNMDQVEELKPPENPAKTTDSRYADYSVKFGESSWELDALSPTYLDKLIRETVEPFIDRDQWERVVAEIEHTQERIRTLAEGWEQ